MRLVAVARVAGAVCLISLASLLLARALPLATVDSQPPKTSDVADEVSVLAGTTDLATEATLMLTWSSSATYAFGQNSTGLVTRTYQVDGGLRCGDPIVAVDGVVVLGYCGRSPLWRTIEPGMAGEDVDDLVDYVGTNLASDRNVESIDDALSVLASTTGATVQLAGDPSNFVWIGPKSLSGPLELSVQVGDVVGPGDSALQAPPAVIEASVDTPQSSEWSFEAAGTLRRPLAVDRSGNVINVSDIYASPLAGSADADFPTEIGGILRLATAIEVLIVPAPAIFGADRPCLLYLPNGREPRVVPIDIVESRIDGVLFLSSAIEPGDQVLLDHGVTEAC